MMNIKRETILPPPSAKRVKEFESFHRVKLPMEFIDFINSSNGGRPNKLVIEADSEDRLIEQFLCLLDDPRNEAVHGQYEISVVIAQIEDRLTDDEEQIGTTLIPFAAIFGGDFLCMDFRQQKDDPSIVLWDHNESDELEPVTYSVADSMGAFLSML
ncbi:SMI1/KNR4 family protein [Corallincola luteus]|uniref:SMI1/KNR4 family protein n=1 Tax=Corallincola luteus TaxID=1775177 RepID=A0ABY2ARX0_9GAMM|nr:SMI1/KNR4 family protein [Corallincola luteus]TCI04926.1 SMI1/KNR4 family protein [Corallincola luteus]